MQIERDVLEGGGLRCQPGLGRESEDAPGRLVEEFAKMQRAVGCLDLARQRRDWWAGRSLGPLRKQGPQR